MSALPVFYNFRRCPYCIRARMALLYAQISVRLREIMLRNKPNEMLAVSPKGTVPVLQLATNEVLEESLDIMQWALAQHDPAGWLNFKPEILEKINQLIVENDEVFKPVLDRYKYADRYDDVIMEQERDKGELFIKKLNDCLKTNHFLYGEHISLADVAIFPFIRQFVHVDKDWFYQRPYPKLMAWLNYFLESELFLKTMGRYPEWKVTGEEVSFPA